MFLIVAFWVDAASSPLSRSCRSVGDDPPLHIESTAAASSRRLQKPEGISRHRIPMDTELTPSHSNRAGANSHLELRSAYD